MSDQFPDRNLIVETKIGEPDVCFYDVRKNPFEVYGLYQYRTEPEFKRLPDEVAKNTSSGVAYLAKNTAGGRVRFCTDSQYVAIKAEMPMMKLMTHMAYTGSAGFDLYVDSPETGMSRFYGAYRPEVDSKTGYESKIKFPTRKLRYFTINFPSYSNVSNLYIGIQQDAELGAGMKYREELPIVYYGSSITQGACASRPGNAYQNIISRRMGLDFLNFGFSGSAKGEPVICEYLASLPMKVFVSDFDHNHSDPELLKESHLRLYRTIRAAHPDIPYIMASRTDDYAKGYNIRMNMLEVITENFRIARASGDKNIYLLDGSEIFRGLHEDECTIDGAHPTDLGFALMADAFESVLRQALMTNSI